MKLINLDENVPESFYIFLSFYGLHGEMNNWNFNLDHRIRSACFNNFIANGFINDYLNGNIDYLPFKFDKMGLSSPSSFMRNIIKDYNIEYNLEYCRFTNFKLYPSRLSGIYAFGDYESCITANKLYNWDISCVKQFKLVQIDGLDSLVRIGKYNMEIVSLLRGIDIMTFPAEDQEQIYRHYWTGGGDISVEVPSLMSGKRERISSGILYEYLIEGILELVK